MVEILGFLTAGSHSLIMTTPARPGGVVYGFLCHFSLDHHPNPVCSGSMLFDPEQEYWNCVCLLLPRRKATLIDIEDFERYGHWDWKVLGTTVYCNETIKSNYGTFRTRVEMHELARTIMNPPHNREVDHISRFRWDNRRQNLRIVTRQQNMMNRAGLPGTSSQYKGVVKTKAGSWSAQVGYKGKRYYLGTFKSEVEAAMAYNQFILDKCPEHGWLNPITVTPDDEPTTKPRRRKYRGMPVKKNVMVKANPEPVKPSLPGWDTPIPVLIDGMTRYEYLRRGADPERLAQIEAKAAAERAAEEIAREERKRRLEALRTIPPHWRE